MDYQTGRTIIQIWICVPVCAILCVCLYEIRFTRASWISFLSRKISMILTAKLIFRIGDSSSFINFRVKKNWLHWLNFPKPQLEHRVQTSLKVLALPGSTIVLWRCILLNCNNLSIMKHIVSTNIFMTDNFLLNTSFLSTKLFMFYLLLSKPTDYTIC